MRSSNVRRATSDWSFFGLKRERDVKRIETANGLVGKRLSRAFDNLCREFKHGPTRLLRCKVGRQPRTRLRRQAAERGLAVNRAVAFDERKVGRDDVIGGVDDAFHARGIGFA